MSKKSVLKIEVLYQDENCLVVDKPPGLMVHSDGRSTGPFLTDWIGDNFARALNVGESMNDVHGNPIIRPGIVHRLDRETSGVMLVALSKDGYEDFKRQFKERLIKKKYLAFVWGEIKEEFGTISRPIGRSGSDFRKWSAQRGARGEMREAETYWTRIWTGVDPDSNQRFSLLEAEPKTGRTHQIRVHFNAIHHPVVGDRLYAPKRAEALGFERTALHSYQIEFDNLAGQKIKIEAKLPEDFVRVIKKFGIRLPNTR